MNTVNEVIARTIGKQRLWLWKSRAVEAFVMTIIRATVPIQIANYWNDEKNAAPVSLPCASIISRVRIRPREHFENKPVRAVV